MDRPIAWWKALENYNHTIWYENPEKYGIPTDNLIPLYEGWQEEYEKIVQEMNPGSVIVCNEDGHFEEIDGIRPIYQEPDSVEEFDPEDSKTDMDRFYSELVDAVREGINYVQEGVY